MLLTPGTRLGPYEIVAPLGAGGMGEVYRARDTRLGREVAVKVLPQHLNRDPEVRARFEREARTVSGLQHPHICTLFDVGRAPIADGGEDIDFLVMELIEGESLSQRLQRGPLPIPELLRVGVQIADALDRAHRSGIVHRDLKPGNIMLTRSGARLMDFGLARATASAGPVSGSGATMAALTQHPTVASPLTAEGAIVGTFQYMAPEQLEGGEADARSDLWALGCVLYEMATGRRAFEGRSQASLITAIMGGQPAPLTQVAPMSPPALERIVQALLAKLPGDRIQTAHDVRLQLQWLSEPASTSGATPAAVPTGPRRRWQPQWTTLALAVGVVALASVTVMLLRRPQPRTVVTEIPVPREVQLLGYWSGMAISPRGDRLVAVGQRSGEPSRILLWRLESPDPQPISGSDEVGFLCWSPDGEDIAYAGMVAGGVERLPASGGAPIRLAEAPDPRGLAWGRRGVLLYAPTAAGPLMRVPENGGTPSVATALDTAAGERGHRFPSFLPDGEHFVFAVMPRGPEGYAIRLGRLGSLESRVVMHSDAGAVFVRPGYLLFVKDGLIVAQRLDVRQARLEGSRHALGPAPPSADTEAEPPGSASDDGWLLLPDLRPPQTKLEWIDRAGVTRGSVRLPAARWRPLDLSPDQASLLATRDGDLWQVDLQRGVPTRLLEKINPFQPARWSPDGQRIVATAHENGREVLRILRAGGGQTADSVPVLPRLFVEAQSWAPDGRSLLVAATGSQEDAARGWDLFTVPLDGGPVRPYAATQAYERESAISPDGRWVARVSLMAGRMDVVVDSYPEPGRRLQVLSGETQYAALCAWGRQGRELLHTTPEGDLVALPLTFADGLPRAGTPETLARLPDGTTDLVTRDGERLLIARVDQASAAARVLLVQNWTGLLSR